MELPREGHVPETVLGLPLHPLLVHGAVVLVPVASILAIVIAVNPERRARWGILAWMLATGALGATIAAKFSGENLKDSLYTEAPPVAVTQHAEYGSSAVWFVMGLWLAVTAVLLLDFDRKRRDGFGSPVLPAVLAVVAIIAAMAATGQILLTSWTGSEAHWQPIVESSMGVSTDA